MENYKKILDLIELNRLTGRLPTASTRRLSTTISCGNQRPRSSYSIASGTTVSDEAHETLHHTLNNRAKLSGTVSSLLMRQDSGSKYQINNEEKGKLKSKQSPDFFKKLLF